jgi:hypothetical protein
MLLSFGGELKALRAEACNALEPVRVWYNPRTERGDLGS